MSTIEQGTVGGLPEASVPPPAEAPAEAPADPVERKAAKATDYIVLVKDDSGFWKEGGKITTARGSEAAALLYAETVKAEKGSFAAVPIRSWKPVPVKTITDTKLVVGE